MSAGNQNIEAKMSLQRRQFIAQLQKTLARSGRSPSDPLTTTVACGPLDRLFVQGLPRAALIECLYRGAGCGTLALWMARAVSCDGRAIAIIDRRRHFYAPAAANLGINPQQLLVVRPENEADEIWAIDQSIRCRAIAAVLWRGGRIGSRHIRRFQLACEDNESLGLLLRPHALGHQLAAAANRLLVQAVGRENETPSATAKPAGRPHAARLRLRVERLRGGGFLTCDSVELEIDDETGTLCEAIPLPVVAQRTASPTRTT